MLLNKENEFSDICEYSLSTYGLAFYELKNIIGLIYKHKKNITIETFCTFKHYFKVFNLYYIKIKPSDNSGLQKLGF